MDSEPKNVTILVVTGILGVGGDPICAPLNLRIGSWHLGPLLAKCKTPGQIIATSTEVTPNGGLVSLVRSSPQNPLNSGLGIIVICPEKPIGSMYGIKMNAKKVWF